MAHTPDWHLLDSAFPGHGTGLTPPPRLLAHDGASLRITNLDRADPPGYVPGTVPRALEFNRNEFRLSATPCMPAISVSCAVTGIELATVPLAWRLVCRHVLCRHVNAGSFRYRGAIETFEREWRGQSHAPEFTLFKSGCTYTYNDVSRVLGGHAILAVAARAGSTVLCDYVHLRIGGTNPTQSDVYRYLDAQLAGQDRNIVHMVRAIFRHESAFTQFAAGPQRAAAMTFSRRHHGDAAQPDCRVRFDWPDDPPNFPLASFDFGVGISQFTRVGTQRISPEVAWDWRENIRLGTNLFLAKLHRKMQPGMTWKHLALASWAAYNGAGAAAERYAQQLAMSDEGAQVSLGPVAAAPTIALIAAAPPIGEPEPWLT